MGLRKNVHRPTSDTVDIDVDSRVGIQFLVAGTVIAFFSWVWAAFLVPLGIGIILLGRNDRLTCRVGLGFFAVALILLGIGLGLRLC